MIADPLTRELGACGAEAAPASDRPAERAAFMPSLILSHAVASWLNEITALRAPLQGLLGEKPLSVRVSRTVWQAEPAAAPMLDCVFEVEGETLILSLPGKLAEALVRTVQNGLTLPSEPARSLVLEFALEPLLAALERMTQRNLQLVRTEEARSTQPYLEFDVAYGELASKARLLLFSPFDGPVPPAFTVLGELLGRLPRQAARLLSELPVIVAGHIGSLRVAIGVLRQAEQGDALLPDTIPLARGQIVLVADRLWAPAEIGGDRLVLRGPFRLRSHPLKSEDVMPQNQMQQQPPSEADIDSIEITLVFECGRWPMPLGTLRTINEGHVFELGRHLDGPVDIVANGQRIGRGDIVRIGEELAVRLRGRLALND
ncbi:type III secretion system cytoplasmic ring protein SctQ [Bradyrhizobium ottawaense]|uniref:type III secretion system cytoplasmic ring protein SctQ n=1 Tax=Bradyrhizobium ottawaense TaxID=931866 RepID=UPI0027D60630|nr:type III secretion system cytoplasmic ring protein SctQ [Bradyrhizobium ottawaense]WQN84774.1 type III secretion system cytoplasmic ring protein SctQ [Bradyrhizobium ottawaense]GMO54480.1 type III secretion system cytoplasmic ring protein SctQ [Bradyrhizobium ottawaense]GMO89681.1 type III secretion system cytoplasmic ring protein SctQ [Bradyrhizobium ottawaense]